MNNSNNSLVSAVAQEEMVSRIDANIQSMLDSKDNFNLPANYSVSGELKTAMLKLSEMKVRGAGGREVPLLSVCSRANVSGQLRYMVLQGLSISQNQVYPICYGTELALQRSYFGDIAVLERIFPQYQIVAQVIHEGDTFDYDVMPQGDVRITNHKQDFFAMDKPVVGAYCNIIEKSTKEVVYCVAMTMAMIKTSWSQSKIHATQEKFPSEMAKRTVIRRCCKQFINTKRAEVNTEVINAYNRTTEGEFETTAERVEREIPKEKAEILSSKPRGKAGLKALLHIDTGKEGMEAVEYEEVQEEPVEPPVEQKGETTQEESTEAVESEETVLEGKLGADGELFPDLDSSEQLNGTMMNEEIPF